MFSCCILISIQQYILQTSYYVFVNIIVVIYIWRLFQSFWAERYVLFVYSLEIHKTFNQASINLRLNIIRFFLPFIDPQKGLNLNVFHFQPQQVQVPISQSIILCWSHLKRMIIAWQTFLTLWMNVSLTNIFRVLAGSCNQWFAAKFNFFLSKYHFAQ